ncbi:oxidoreductase [Phyllobacterium sp. P30BS-XVII]|uniref:oxidoreductase n=1 Tax=Phyllobacterium sp. P30BS-XVII TaxID=2587046 RepID=UPI000DDC7B3A|nr:oxidoreductase [Phyllobacterium sp. P30BS-XVII]MBA8903878.1 NAD(P)-dependent dehydrogenase (short-subunit alcohol dehydrogenase family) [Phyllobacterium sp. P30BS-XVII]
MALWTANDIPDQSGRTFLVTGANSGLGYITSLELARRGARVLMTARDETKGRAAVAQIRLIVPRAQLELHIFNMADLEQVKQFALGLITNETAIDVLINNAGIMMPPRTLTPQGFELQFGVNHLAHFALTGLLIERLSKGQDPRVVTVTSDLHKRGTIRFDDLTGAKAYGRVAFYAQSKFANAVFGLELDRRLRAHQSPVRSLLAHPGYSATNLQLSGPTGFLNLFMRIGNRFMAQTAEMGALNLLYAACAADVEGGQFFGPDGRNEMKGYPTLVEAVSSAKDPVLADRLWQLSVELTGVRSFQYMGS